ncbi:MAG TPA: type IIL restriction-modification enzyme MmeI [Bacteroidales bacterium]|nr:type IIL restriction-modification enzyme MmeI [Bacteroidales bacterium]
MSVNKDIYIQKRIAPIAPLLPKMVYGNKPVDDGNLLLSGPEKNELVTSHPIAQVYIKRIMGSDELINGIERWCLWITDEQWASAKKIDAIQKRVENVQQMRLKSKDLGANKLANKPYQFREMYTANYNQIIIPAVSSENREYIPLGFCDSNIVVTNRNFAIYDPELYIFGIISSLMHMVWVRAVAGRLETRFNYSSTICYNAFPFPIISDTLKQQLTQCTLKILEEREKHPEKTLAELYDPDKMPDGLREAHHQNDLVVERCYRSKPFTSDEERLEHLFKLYEQMIEEEKNRGTLFEAESRPAKKAGKKKA